MRRGNEEVHDEDDGVEFDRFVLDLLVDFLTRLEPPKMDLRLISGMTRHENVYICMYKIEIIKVYGWRG